MKKIRWGILSTAKIGLEKVIPAMQAGKNCEITAIASRNPEFARAAAEQLNIEKAFGSYEELLSDPAIDAVYIPLPNHLHVPWTLKALKAGKHVLCEKPIALSAAEAQQLLDATRQYPHLKVMEAFMYRFHPQWLFVKKLVDDGTIGSVRAIQAFFSYYNTDSNNIRNKKELGGGSLMDIGCYCISQSRFILGKEPVSVLGNIEYDPQMEIDFLASAIMDFGICKSVFTCSTQLTPSQSFRIYGTEGIIEIEIPVNIPPNEKSRIWLQRNHNKEEILFEPYNQYTLQAEIFSKAILDYTNVPTPLEDGVNNMKVIEAIKKSNETGQSVKII
ncbi:Gfo/Idh/MocA family oxidoreductase [Pedobacter sp. P351]|uniref:Gfo/Idh/MocA family protein n=1 Tax=Pedobacter superstes TaxID=3133441 RepID=UPI0030B2D5C5